MTGARQTFTADDLGFNKVFFFCLGQIYVTILQMFNISNHQ